jgi:hypothetical protein
MYAPPNFSEWVPIVQEKSSRYSWRSVQFIERSLEPQSRLGN